MTAWQLYWLTRLDAINGLGVPFVVFGVIGAIIAIVFLIIGKATGDEDVSLPSKMALKVFVPILVFGVVATCLIPSTKEMAFIIVAPKLYDAVSKNEQLNAMPEKVVTLANEWLEELRPEKK